MSTSNRFLLAIFLLVVSSLACIAPVADLTPPVDSVKPKAQDATAENLLATVTAFQSLNVRERAGDDQRVIGALYHGDQVDLTGKCSADPDPKGWAEIVWKDGTAWVNSDFLSDNLCKEE